MPGRQSQELSNELGMAGKLFERFRREGDEWTLSEVSGPDATLHLESIDCHVTVAAIYEKVEFNP